MAGFVIDLLILFSASGGSRATLQIYTFRWTGPLVIRLSTSFAVAVYRVVLQRSSIAMAVYRAILTVCCPRRCLLLFLLLFVFFPMGSLPFFYFDFFDFLCYLLCLVWVFLESCVVMCLVLCPCVIIGTPSTLPAQRSLSIVRGRLLREGYW